MATGAHPKEAEILQCLAAGLSNRAITERLNVGAATVAELRAKHRFPAARPALTVQQKFVLYTRETDGGHMVWIGERAQDCTPILSHRGRKLSVRPVAFEIEHGRRPTGYVKPACWHPWCVAPACQSDAADRALSREIPGQLDAAAALLGEN